jgi:phenylalanyl-tRNA synthetase beta chain
MKVPISWLKDFVDLEGIVIEELAHTLTVAGLEVEEIHYIGLPMPAGRQETKVSGLAWDPAKSARLARTRMPTGLCSAAYTTAKKSTPCSPARRISSNTKASAR